MLTRRRFVLNAATLALASQTRFALAQTANVYHNPILGGDHPDASPIRVGDDFYMTHSSFDFAPGLLIWHSRNLINCKVNLGTTSLQDRRGFGGHMVSGHVDGVAEILERRDFDGMAHFAFRAPAPLAKFIAVKGSVALDGVSLTVNAVLGDQFEVLLIPPFARGDDAGRMEGRRSRQHRGGPDGPLRGASGRGGWIRARRAGGLSSPRGHRRA